MLSRTATPRLTRGKPRFNTLGAIGRVHSHSGLPLLRSSAATIVGPDVTYMIPLATTGVDSTEPVPGGWYTQAGRSLETLLVEICVSGEKRCESYDPEYISHWPSGCAASVADRRTTTVAQAFRPATARLESRSKLIRVISHLATSPDTRPGRRAARSRAAPHTTASACPRARDRDAPTPTSAVSARCRWHRGSGSRTRLR